MPDLCSAYILHTRQFRDSSVILDCFTQDQGIVSMVARGARRPRSRLYGLIQPFIALQLSWIGRGELKTLTQIEAMQVLCSRLSGEKIALGLYLNELLLRLLNHFDPHPKLFFIYHETIMRLALAEGSDISQSILRHFEKNLLAELGYGLDLTLDGRTGEKISPELLYCYEPTMGLIESCDPLGKLAISGASVMALERDQYANEIQLREAKNLMRFILAFYLGNKPLHSRKLFLTRNKNEQSQ